MISASPPRDRPGVWAWWALAAYAGLGAGLILLPLSYGSIIEAVGDAVAAAGVRWFGYGWVEFAANIVFFLPLGFLVVVATRRIWPGVVAPGVLSVCFEVAQVVIPPRDPSLRDVVANVLGAAIGVAIAWFTVIRRSPSAPRSATMRAR